MRDQLYNAIACIRQAQIAAKKDASLSDWQKQEIDNLGSVIFRIQDILDEQP
jgi:hypothetical protein